MSEKELLPKIILLCLLAILAGGCDLKCPPPDFRDLSPPSPLVPPDIEPNAQYLFPQLIDGKLFVWNEPSASVDAAFTPTDPLVLGRPYAMRLAYVTKPGASAGWGIDGLNFDARPYQALTFRILGGQGGERFHVGIKSIKNGREVEKKVEVEVEKEVEVEVTDRWQLITIPLCNFAGVDLDSVWNVNIGFSPALSPKSGEIYVDEFLFVEEMPQRKRPWWWPFGQ